MKSGIQTTFAVVNFDQRTQKDEELARHLVELGYRGSGDTLSRKEFEERKRQLQELNKPSVKVQRELCSAGISYSLALLFTNAQKKMFIKTYV